MPSLKATRMKPVFRFSATLLLLFACGARGGATNAPSARFDLRQWKLQIPGPKDVKALDGYASGYFFLTADNELCFRLDASEKGATPNAAYVRSELRHLPEWDVKGAHSLSGEFRVASALTPDKVTALQIHGIAPDGGSAPPLVRIAVNAGHLVAALKTDSGGKKNETIQLVRQLGPRFVKVDVAVRDGRLTVSVDGERKLDRDLSYWPHRNYFKAGCYPQATQGTAEVIFRSLRAE